MMPTDTDGGSLMVSGSVRPRARVVWPIFMSALGARVGTARPLASILRRVNMRVWSVATTLAGIAVLPAGHRHVDGGGLVGEIEGAGDDVAVGADDEAAGRPHAAADHAAAGGAHHVLAALRLDLHHARGARATAALIACSLRSPRSSSARAAGASRTARPAMKRKVVDASYERSLWRGNATYRLSPSRDAQRSELRSGASPARRGWSENASFAATPYFLFGGSANVSSTVLSLSPRRTSSCTFCLGG